MGYILHRLGGLWEAFFRSLCFAVLIKVLLRPVPGRATFLGKPVAVSLHFAPTGMSACCWSCHTDTACAYVATACPETTATPEEPTAVVCGWWARILLWLGVASMPTCRVWAAPASIKVLHQVAQQLGQCRSNTGAPEDLATPNLSDGSRIVDPGEGTAVDLPATHDLQAEFRGNWLGVSTRR